MSKRIIMQKLNTEYSNKRRRAQYIAEQNLNFALTQTEFSKLYREISTKELELAKISLEENKKKEISELEKEIKTLNSKIDKVLAKLNISRSDFEPKYDCNICKDSGRVDGGYCQCFNNLLIKELFSASGLSESKLASFEDFDESIAIDKEHRSTLKKLKDIFISFAEKFPHSKYQNIIVSGKTGVGKTFALECVTTEIMKKGHSACFVTAFGMNNQFLRYHTTFDSSKHLQLDILLEPELLVIDDLGTEPVLRNVTQEYLYLVLSERMLKNKTTLISTNHTPAEIQARYGERIFSRLYNKDKSLNIQIQGSDLRLTKK